MTIRLSESAEQKVQEFKAKYPSPQSAVMPALYLAQSELGFISKEAVSWVADRIGMPPVQVLEVASFYTMYYKKPVGRYHVQVCRTLSCALVGAAKVTERLHQKWGVGPNEVTPDGMWSYEEVECLGSCGSGPLCQINDRFFEQLTPEKLESILAEIERDKPDLRLSMVSATLGSGEGLIAGHTPSAIAYPDVEKNLRETEGK